MADVFLSYQRLDRDLAQKVDRALSRAGLSVWWDDDVNPQESWDREIEREIAASRFVLVLWTRHSVDSEWVRNEALEAKSCQPSKLIQARFEGCTLPIAFKRTQYVDLDRDRPDRGPGWARLLRWLGVSEDRIPVERPVVPLAPPRPPPDRTGPPPEVRHDPSAGSGMLVFGIVAFAGVAFLAASMLGFVDAESLANGSPLIGWIVVGLAAGAIARFISPGRDPGGCVFTVALGIGGAILAGFIGQSLGWYSAGDGAGLFAAIFGAILILLAYRLIARR